VFRLALIPLLFVPHLFAAEPSAFSAGDLNSKEPYGLTKTEGYIFKNKERLTTLQNDLLTLETKQQALKEALEGLKSIVRNSSEEDMRQRRSLGELASQLQTEQERSLSLEGRVEGLEKSHQAYQEQVSKSFEKLEKVLNTHSETIKTINGEYVSKRAMKKALLALGKELEGLRSAQVKAKNSAKESDLDQKPSSVIFEDAKSSLKSKAFATAQTLLKFLKENRTSHKPAEVHYLLGETYYQTGHFNDAVTLFKESVRLDDKASYLPVLLFHTGVSLQKLKKFDEAKKFYTTLIQLYPKSYLVSSAKSRLNKLK